MIPGRWAPSRSARTRLTLFFVAAAFVAMLVAAISLYLAIYLLLDRTIGSSQVLVDSHTLQQLLKNGGAQAGEALGTTNPNVLASGNGRGAILRGLLWILLIVFVGVMLAAAATSWIIAGRILRPVEKITRAADRAAAGRLDSAITLDGPPDEFRRLADAFDTMLERLDASFTAQRRFAANASHELKTPLAATQTLLDVALMAPDEFTVPELARTLRTANSRNIDTVEALLELAEAESGQLDNEPVDLDEIVRSVVSANQANAREAGVDLRHESGALPLVGDARLFTLLVGNLVGNAVRHNVARGHAVVSTTGSTLRVVNTGVVLDPTTVERLSEPFFRGSGRVAGSHGLGLALVRAVAERHGARLDLLGPPEGGLEASITFPPRHSAT